MFFCAEGIMTCLGVLLDLKGLYGLCKLGSGIKIGFGIGGGRSIRQSGNRCCLTGFLGFLSFGYTFVRSTLFFFFFFNFFFVLTTFFIISFLFSFFLV